MNSSIIDMAKSIPGVRTLYRWWRLLRTSVSYVGDLIAFTRLSRGAGGRFSLALSPCLADRTATTSFDRHYVFHPAWAARILAETRPREHVDISSSLSFVAIVSAFVPTRFYDYRPAMLDLANLSSEHADLLALPFADASIPSLSCMHVVEHVGLGRYGDKLDPSGDLKAVAELKRVLAQGGELLFVVPVGKPRILFNAHRIYSFEQIMEYMAPLSLMEFALVTDDVATGLIRNAPSELVAEQHYGCGCFRFRKDLN